MQSITTDLNYFKEEISEFYSILLDFRNQIRKENKEGTSSNPALFMVHFTDQTYINWISALIYRKRLLV